PDFACSPVSGYVPLPFPPSVDAGLESLEQPMSSIRILAHKILIAFFRIDNTFIMNLLYTVYEISFVLINTFYYKCSNVIYSTVFSVLFWLYVNIYLRFSSNRATCI